MSKQETVWEKSHIGKMLTGSGRVNLPFFHNIRTSSYQAVCIKDLENIGVLFFLFNIPPTMNASETFSKSQPRYMPCVHQRQRKLSHILSSLLSIPTLNPQT